MRATKLDGLLRLWYLGLFSRDDVRKAAEKLGILAEYAELEEVRHEGNS